jgi:hypothetical protein
MNRTSGVLALSAVVLALSACGGGSDGDDAAAPPQPKVAVDDLSTGSYVVSLGDENAPTVGKYYAAADGSRLLVVADGSDQSRQLYRRAAREAWVAVPASDMDVSVTLLRSDAVTADTPAVASMAGSYVTLVAAGVAASFTVNAAGDIVAGASACKLSGKLSANALPNTLKLSLTTAGCGTLPASSSGVATVDGDYAPAKFRMVADSGTQVADLWAFAE